MTAYNTKGTKIKVIPKSAAATTVVPTAISNAKPAVVSIPDVSGITEGDLVKVGSVGFEELNNQLFMVGTVDGTGNTFELMGSDTSATAGSLAASPSIDVYSASDAIIVCLSELTFGAASTNNIGVGTFCDPSATLPGLTTLGDITCGGYVDKMDAGLAELIAADSDGENRIIFVEMASQQGYLVGEVAFSGLSYTVPIEGGYAYSVTGTQTSRIKWVHD